MGDRLDLAVKNYYDEMEMPEASRARLRERIERERSGVRTRHRPATTLLGVAAVIATLLVSIAALVNVAEVAEREVLERRVIAQAATMHNQQLAVEVEAKDYVELRHRLDRLGFTPVEPERLRSMRIELLGARYSTIDGSPAVQIKFYDPDGNVCSLYQAPASGGLAGVRAISGERDGVGVEVWREKGLVMVLTRPLT